PILGQNYGAKEWRRIKRAMLDAHKVNLLFCILISIILLMCSNLLIYSFNMSGQAADIIDFFCSFIAFTFIFNGMLFLSNAALNNLGSPKTSSVLNVGKATLGTIPFVIYGGMAWGAPGVLIGQALGSAMFGLLGVIIARRLVYRIAFTR
ncbi:MAG: MATE family efflux transporter, partial [Pseudomonadota bacterium]|nr:MATE family efflux transporter [Pseudomonadota bacterium]